MDEVVAHSISTQRLTMFLLSVFSALALVLSAVGIYGVISYLTGQRTHEIGVRVALGASSSDVMRMVLGGGMRIALIGVAIGLAAAFGLTRLITTLIYGVGTSDPLTFASVAICFPVLRCLPATFRRGAPCAWIPSSLYVTNESVQRACYSKRRATVGLTRVARGAGIQQGHGE
jgi:ABC-type antimicrobial peptide transport system permease subunit